MRRTVTVADAEEVSSVLWLRNLMGQVRVLGHLEAELALKLTRCS